MPHSRHRASHPERGLRHATVAALVAAVSVAGAAAGWESPPVPARPSTPVDVAAVGAPPAAPAPVLPEALTKPGATITLAQVVDVALQNNPLTRASYLQALSAAAQLGSKRAPYYPSLDVNVSEVRSNQIFIDSTTPQTGDVYGPGVTVNWLLLDLGGRAANVDDAKFSLIAADWSHNATIQNVILGVETTYVQYVDAKAQLEAAEASVKASQTALEAANGRHDAGVGTSAAVLQAKTALSQAQLTFQGLQGAVLALRGSLATAMGLPADTPYDVGTLPIDVPLDRAAVAVEQLTGTARTRRPDLAAARALAAKADAHVRAVRSDGLPSLSLSATAGRSYYSPAPAGTPIDTWSASLVVAFPLFTGFENSYNVEKARADAGVAQAQADTLEQQVLLQVWTSYYAFQTATQLVRTSRDLLASAEQSERVALGRYKEGVGTILDLLAAQAALAGARSQEIQARAGWFVALAQLAHDTGTAAPLDQPISVVTGSAAK